MKRTAWIVGAILVAAAGIIITIVLVSNRAADEAHDAECGTLYPVGSFDYFYCTG